MIEDSDIVTTNLMVSLYVTWQSQIIPWTQNKGRHFIPQGAPDYPCVNSVILGGQECCRVGWLNRHPHQHPFKCVSFHSRNYVLLLGWWPRKNCCPTCSHSHQLPQLTVPLQRPLGKYCSFPRLLTWNCRIWNAALWVTLTSTSSPSSSRPSRKGKKFYLLWNGLCFFWHFC